MSKLTVKQKELLRSQVDGEWIRDFGLRKVYVYVNSKGKWCYRYRGDDRGNLYLTLTCRALFSKGHIIPDWDCYDSEAICHKLDKDCPFGGVKAVPCWFTLKPVKSLIEEV